MIPKFPSTVFSSQKCEIPHDEFAMLDETDMAKRETVGKRLKRARLELGMGVPELVEKIKRDYRAEVGITTVHFIEKDRVPNPGLKTIEFIALGDGLDPLEVFALGLDEPPELEPGFKQSQFAQLWKSYSKLDKEQKAFVDDYIETLIQKINRWR